MPMHLIEMGEQPDNVREILIAKEEFVIGRGIDCDLQINEAAISRHHCMLRGRGEDYTLSDLGSSNGTYLNGHRLISQAPLSDGDEVKIGDHRFYVEFGDREGIIWGRKDASPMENTLKVSRPPKDAIKPTKDANQKEENDDAN